MGTLHHRYDWLFLRSVVSAGYLGWILFSLNFTLRTFVSTNNSRQGVLGSTRTPKPKMNTDVPQESPAVSCYHDGLFKCMCSPCSRLTILYPHPSKLNALSIVVFVFFAIILTIKQSPPLYYAYVAFPVYFWNRVLLDRRELLGTVFKTGRDYGWIRTFGSVLGYVIALEVLVSYRVTQLQLLLDIFFSIQEPGLNTGDTLQPSDRIVAVRSTVFSTGQSYRSASCSWPSGRCFYPPAFKETARHSWRLGHSLASAQASLHCFQLRWNRTKHLCEFRWQGFGSVNAGKTRY
jgi:hypothetical protein